MENKKTCSKCKYFRQHYLVDEKSCVWVYCGHCVCHHRTKNRKPDTPACADFAKKDRKMNDLVTKRYLTKSLLEYVLSLELPPEIPEGPEKLR